MKLTAAIDEYLADMRSQGRINSPRTERSYYARLLMHADDVANRDPRKTGRADIKRTLRRWDHPNTQANVRAILVSFYDWAMEEGIRPDNPARQVRRPRKRPTSVYRLTRAEAASMLDAAETFQDQAVVHVGAGARLALNGVQVAAAAAWDTIALHADARLTFGIGTYGKARGVAWCDWAAAEELR